MSVFLKEVKGIFREDGQLCELRFRAFVVLANFSRYQVRLGNACTRSSAS